MATGEVSVKLYSTTAERDAILDADEGDLCYVKETHRYYAFEDDDAWHELARAEDLP
jgi:hypothetical protein